MKKERNFNLHANQNSLIIDSQSCEVIVNFSARIEEIESFENVIIVRVYPNGNIFINENIFCISYEGKILWQIKELKYVYEHSPYTGIFKEGEFLKVYNWDGTNLLINPETGDILEEGYSK